MNTNDTQGSRHDGTCHNVLFLCSPNSICSMMAEALLNQAGGNDFRAFSGEIEPSTEIDSLETNFLERNRIRHDRGRNYREFLAPDAPRMNFIISLGDCPPAGLPTEWPGEPRIIHWHITEPVSGGSPVAKAHSLRKAFAELETRIRLFVLVHQRETMKLAATAA